MSCSNSQRDVTHLSLSDNEDMLYDNYIKTHAVREVQEAPRQNSVSSHNQFVNPENDVHCVYTCATPPLRIGIMPMSFSTQSALEEINNTIAFVKSNVDSHKYHISIIDKDTLQNLSLVDLDVIIGPFKDDDVKLIDETLKKQKLSIPVISLTTKILSSSSNIYYFGYSADDIIKSTVENATKMGFTNYGVLMPNNAVGSATYNLFKKHIENSGKNVARVEFYDESSMENIQKFIGKLQMSINQKYYVAADGTVFEDNFSFAKNIKDDNEKSVTLKDGKKYDKKYKKMDALIVDSDMKNLDIIFQELSQHPEFARVAIIGSPRIVDGVITMSEKEKYADISKGLLFPASYKFYRNFYISYTEQFGKNPTRLGTTLYETIIYLITLHNKNDITKELNFKELPMFVGLNGNMVISHGNKHLLRTVNMCEFKNGTVTELVND